MISTQVLLFLYMLVGVIANRIGMIRDDNRQVLVRLLMDIAMPMMVLNAFNKVTSAEEIRSSIMVVAMAALGCLVTGLIGRFIFRREPDNRRKVLQYASMFSNAGNAGLPVINLVFGPAGVFLASGSSSSRRRAPGSRTCSSTPWWWWSTSASSSWRQAG